MLEDKSDSNSYGIASLVLGIVSIVLCWVPVLGLASGIVGIIMAVKQRKISSNGITTAGLITSIVGTALSAIYMIITILLVMVGVIGGGMFGGLLK
ncbi:MAG: hypothetical protein COT14_00695 [Candidatus Diapherotrites archaeon CG08_land_8_20_14_0_20_30_16]|nr:MAG: hypothetical protein COT14_00695 [Candidatus Diapherotrites archaeon CG08_land_8_20_14_0_20_30_16]